MTGLSYVITFLFLGYYCVILPKMLFKRNLFALKMITLEMVLQNFICIVVCNVFPYTISQVIILYKELIFYGAVVISFILNSRFKIKKEALALTLMVLICIPYFFIGSASLYTKLICFRQIMTPIILVLYGRTLKLSASDCKDYLKFIVQLALFQLLFGIFEQFIIGDELWLSLHIEKYMESKGFSKWVYNSGLPGNFYSADLYVIFGSIRRMVGIVADPLLMGHFLAICIVILLFYDVFDNKIKQYLSIGLLTIGVCLTLSKGAILVIGVCYVYKIWRKNKPLALILVVLMVGVLILMIKNNTFSTIARHIGGLTSSVGTTFIGGGLGSAGNYAGLYGGNSSTTGESYIGAIIGQMGMIGTFFFLFCMANTVKHALDINKNKMCYASCACILGVVIESFMSESAINFVGSGIAFILLGIFSSNALDGKQKKQLYLDYYAKNQKKRINDKGLEC